MCNCDSNRRDLYARLNIVVSDLGEYAYNTAANRPFHERVSELGSAVSDLLEKLDGGLPEAAVEERVKSVEVRTDALIQEIRRGRGLGPRAARAECRLAFVEGSWIECDCVACVEAEAS